MDAGAGVIAKITRGERVGDIAAYLHGPGKSNEHYYVQDKHPHVGGMVIASSIGVEGATDPAEWAADLRQAQRQRPDITKPIWQASLRVAPEDRVMDDREWADIASHFMDEMGVGEHPWVAVRHGKDHVHVVVSRVSDTGEVWHGRNDRRAAQTACGHLEQLHELVRAPRRKKQPKKTIKVQRKQWQEKSREVTEDRSVSPEQKTLRRQVQQLTREQWAELDSEMREVIEATDPERIPGAEVRSRSSSRRSPEKDSATAHQQRIRHQVVEREHGYDR